MFQEMEIRGDSVCRAVALKAALVMGVLIPFYFLPSQHDVNTWSPVLLGSICLCSLFSLRKAGLSQVILSPIAWFLLACSVYYGVGPLLYIYGNEMTINYANTFYYVNEHALWRTNLLNIASIALILFFFSTGMSLDLLRPFKYIDTIIERAAKRVRGHWLSRLSSRDVAIGSLVTLKRAACFFAAIGVLFTLLTHYLRSALGQDFLMPGIFYTLAKVSLAGLFLYSLLYFRGVREIKWQFLLLTGFVGYFSITSLMKQNILEFMIVLFLGYFLARPSIRKLVIAACVVLVMFPALDILTTYGRVLMWTDHSHQTNISKMIVSASKSGAISRINNTNKGFQRIWARISYASAQAFAMDAYDAGRPGNSFKTALWAFVPRLIYPDKPVITQGEVFTTLVKGAAIGGGTGAGYFGEAYWNLGWFGVLVMSMLVGVLLAALGQFNNNMVLTGMYQFFPVAFMALHIGYRVDDWLVATTFNSVPFMIVLYIMVALISRRGIAESHDKLVK